MQCFDILTKWFVWPELSASENTIRNNQANSTNYKIMSYETFREINLVLEIYGIII